MGDYIFSLCWVVFVNRGEAVVFKPTSFFHKIVPDTTLFFCMCHCCLSQLLDPKLKMQSYDELFSAVRLLVSEDQCEGRFVFGHKVSAMSKKAKKAQQGEKVGGDGDGKVGGGGGENSKSYLQTMLVRAGRLSPIYKTTQLKHNQFRSKVIFNGLEFVGQPRGSKKEAEKEAATEALQWLTGESQLTSSTIDSLSGILKTRKKKQATEVSRWR